MRALLLGILLTALLASVPSSSAAPVVGTRDAQAELHLRNHIAIEGVLRYGRTVKVSRGTWNRTPDRYHFQWFRNESRDPRRHGADLPAGCRRRRAADQGPGLRQEARLRLGPGDRSRRDQRRLPRAGAAHGHLPDRDPRPPDDQRAGVRAAGGPDLRRPARLAQRGRGVPAGEGGQRLLAGTRRGELAAPVLQHLQRGVELPGRTLRRHQPDALEVRLDHLVRRGTVAAGLPQPGGRPRDRPLARPRPPRLPRRRRRRWRRADGASSPRVSTAAATTRCGRSRSELWCALSSTRQHLEVLRGVELALRDGGQAEHVEDQVGDVAVADGLARGGVADAAGARVGVRLVGVEGVEVTAGRDAGAPDQERDPVVGEAAGVGVPVTLSAVVGGDDDEGVVARARRSCRWW